MQNLHQLVKSQLVSVTSPYVLIVNFKDFDLVKHVLVFNINRRWNLVAKFQILLGRKSSSNIVIKKRIRTREEKNTTENQGTTQSRQQKSSKHFCTQAFR